MTLAYVAWEAYRRFLAVNALGDQRQLSDIAATIMRRMDGALGTSVAVEEIYGGRGEIHHVSKCREATLQPGFMSLVRGEFDVCAAAHTSGSSRAMIQSQ